jgi:hypothetical protein
MSDQHEIVYIRVEGRLDEPWADDLNGFVMVTRAGGATLLAGPAAEQEALYGALAKLRDLNVSLRLLVQAACPCPKNCPRHGQCSDCMAHHSAKDKLPFCFRSRTRWERHCAALMGPRA